jgi:NitT/TauT family transport system ATP-binding protein
LGSPSIAAGIHCRGVAKAYGRSQHGVDVLRDVTFSVGAGEFVAVLGPSGCGKSTLLMMVGGLEPVTAGRIDIGSSEVAGPRREIGIIFQDATLLPWKTALDNILFPIDIAHHRRSDYLPRAAELLRSTGLEAAAKRKPSQLSGGMRQRVSICRALIADPDILLMDEPFSALDAITRDDMNVMMLDLWEHYHKTAMFVTHSIRESVLLADRVLVMGGQPATIIDDVPIPFERPRDIGLAETPEFNRICRDLRLQINQAHGSMRLQ